MTDFLLPPDLGIAAATPNLDANTASFKSPTVGSTRSVERLGDALRFQFNFVPVNDDPLFKRQRGRLQAFLSSLRGQSGRVWMTPPGAMLRGSFPATELFANNNFSSGISPWQPSSSQYVLSSLDYGVRATRAVVTAAVFALFQNILRTPGTPYALRAFVNAGKGNPLAYIADNDVGTFTATQQGMIEYAYTVPASTTTLVGIYDAASSGNLAGNFFDAKWASFSRCALVDNGPNLLTASDTFSTNWSVAAGSVTANASTGPDGTADATAFFETTANSTHSAQQSTAVSSAAADFTLSVFVQGQNRGFCYVQLAETLGGTATSFYANLTTGAITSLVTGANWTAISQIAVPYGNGWWRIILTARKTNAAISISSTVGAATAAGISSYVGTASPTTALNIWRASLAQSSVPVAPVQTAGAAVTGTLQTGLQLNIKGLPVSTQGLLLPGDWIECNGQLNQMAAQLDGDAAGLGTAILVRPPRNSPADGTGFVVNNPMGKFLVTSNSTAWNEQPGRLSDASIELVEDISF
jgi:hypothetical protein